MKRDMELIRQILQNAEALEFVNGQPCKKYTAKSVEEAYQIQLMLDAGLVEAEVMTTAGIPSNAILRRITWAGHDFLDAVRADTNWNKIKKNVIKPGASFTFSLVAEYAKAEIKKQLFPPDAVN